MYQVNMADMRQVLQTKSSPENKKHVSPDLRNFLSRKKVSKTERSDQENFDLRQKLKRNSFDTSQDDQGPLKQRFNNHYDQSWTISNDSYVPKNNESSSFEEKLPLRWTIPNDSFTNISHHKEPHNESLQIQIRETLDVRGRKRENFQINVDHKRERLYEIQETNQDGFIKQIKEEDILEIKEETDSDDDIQIIENKHTFDTQITQRNQAMLDINTHSQNPQSQKIVQKESQAELPPFYDPSVPPPCTMSMNPSKHPSNSFVNPFNQSPPSQFQGSTPFNHAIHQITTIQHAPTQSFNNPDHEGEMIDSPQFHPKQPNTVIHHKPKYRFNNEKNQHDNSYGSTLKYNIVIEKKGLRPIIIDGSNVAYWYGKQRGKDFSAKGIEICVQFFKNRGHTTIKAFLPESRQNDDSGLLEKLYQDDNIVFTPSRWVGNRLVNGEDDLCIIEFAEKSGGIIISRDIYKDVLKQNPKWKTTIDRQLLMPTFADDMVMFPHDPLGQHGPNLDQFLKF